MFTSVRVSLISTFVVVDKNPSFRVSDSSALSTFPEVVAET